LIDDLDIYISTPDEVSGIFGTIKFLMSKITGLTFILSTRNAQLLNRFSANSLPGWQVCSIRQEVTEMDYIDIASRLWQGLNDEYLFGMPAVNDMLSKPKYKLNIQNVSAVIRLQFVEQFLYQQDVLKVFSDFKSLGEYEAYVECVLNN